MPIPNLRGKLVVVTGAASGIGLETALAFARQGANLAISDINAPALEETARQVRDLGVTCRTAVVDVSDADAVRAFAEEVTAQAGVPDVVVNNAGIAFLGPFTESDGGGAWLPVFPAGNVGGRWPAPPGQCRFAGRGRPGAQYERLRRLEIRGDGPV